MIKLIVFLFLFIIHPLIYGLDLNLRVEVATGGIFEQQGLLAKGDKVTIIRNSNFYCPTESVVYLGQVKIDADSGLMDRLNFIEITRKNLPINYMIKEKERVVHFVGSLFVPDDHYLHHFVSETLKGSCDKFSNITAEPSDDLVAIKLNGDSVEVKTETEKQWKSFKKEKLCRSVDGNLHCSIPSWGIAIFKN